MKIWWLVSSLHPGVHGTTSEVASVRTRAVCPAGVLRRLQPEADIRVEVLDGRTNAPFAPDLVVCGKILSDPTRLLEAVRRTGAPLLLDLCDDVFSLAHLKPMYARALPFADSVVCSSLSLLECTLRAVAKPAFHVPDMIEGERTPPTWSPRPGRLRLLFYGQPANLPPLGPALALLASLREARLSLLVLTRLDAARGWYAEILAKFGGTIDLQLRQWSLEEQAAALRECDAVLIPSDEAASRQVKTANRLTTALWAGKPCVAYPLPSYQALSEFAYLDVDLSRAVRALLAASRERVLSRCEAGQRFIADCFGDELVSTEWWRVFEQVAYVRGAWRPGPV